jgi:hypothetical protein
VLGVVEDLDTIVRAREPAHTDPHATVLHDRYGLGLPKRPQSPVALGELADDPRGLLL